MAGYVALRGLCLEREYLYIQKRFPVNKEKYRYILKTNERGKVIYFSPHIFRGVKLKCAKARFY